MKRRHAILLTTLIAAGCGGGGRGASPGPTGSPSGGPAPAAASSPPPAPVHTAPSAAVVEPANVAGLPLGATKPEAVAVLGGPTSQRRDTDVGGSGYDSLRWDFDDDGGLVLNFRTESAMSPRLTDWSATAPGPRTPQGIQVADAEAKVVAAHGSLQPFCCDAKVASVQGGGGRMIIVVDDASGKVTQIIGGDENYWSRSIAD
jgi:hypothetical protein